MKLTWIAERLQWVRTHKVRAKTDTEQAWWAGYEAAMREVWEQENK